MKDTFWVAKFEDGNYYREDTFKVEDALFADKLDTYVSREQAYEKFNSKIYSKSKFEVKLLTVEYNVED